MLRTRENRHAWADPRLWLFVLVTNALCICAWGWGEFIGYVACHQDWICDVVALRAHLTQDINPDRLEVVQDPGQLDQVVTSMLNWGTRALAVVPFTFTLMQLRGLVTNLLDSKFSFDIYSIFNLGNSLSCVELVDVNKSRVLPKAFRSEGLLMPSFRIIYDGFLDFAQNREPLKLIKALKALQSLKQYTFEEEQVLRMEVEARLKFPVRLRRTLARSTAPMSVLALIADTYLSFPLGSMACCHLVQTLSRCFR